MATQTGSIDLKAAKKSYDDAAKVATNYVVDITNGILVHPSVDYDNGVKITDKVEIMRGSGGSSASVAEFGTSARIGENASGKSRTEIGTAGMQIIRNAFGTDTIIANLGYGSGKDSGGGTSDAPFYTLGKRGHGSAVGNYSVAEGFDVVASGFMSHAEGAGTNATGLYAHSQGYLTHARGKYSHAQNYGTFSERRSQTVIGEFNELDTTGEDGEAKGKYIFIIGNGTADNVRSNALAVDWSGDLFLALNIYASLGTTDFYLYDAINVRGWASDVIV